jgi:hypothetical protein
MAKDEVVMARVGQAAQDVALAALLGGNLFGRLALNPALQEVSDKSERGKVLNRAWKRYGTVNSLALLTLVAGWLRSAGSDQMRDLAMGSVIVTGLASAAGGISFAQQAPGGAVPMQSGSDTAPEASPRAVALKRVVNALGALNIVSEVALAVVRAAESRPRRRLFG